MTVIYNSISNFLQAKYPQTEVGDGTNRLLTSATGVQRLEGSATLWEDLRFPFTATKIGANAKPDFDETNVGYLFPQNSTTEILYGIGQLPHTWKEGSTLYPHIHWQQMNTNNVVWSISYKLFNLGAAVPAGWTTITGNNTQNVFPYTSGSMSQLTSIGNGIDATGMKISSLLLFKIFRNDNVDGGAGGGDALAFEMDVHYELDSYGSDTLFTK